MVGYVPSDASEREAMLHDIGFSSYEDIYVDIPSQMRAAPLNLPKGASELEVKRDMEALAAKNTVFDAIFRGAGAYARFCPAVVRVVMDNPILKTAYTPYQAEISQGVLQSIFEYQSMSCELTGMDAACASAYDGSTAAAEGALMCLERKRTVVLVSEGVSPQTMDVLETYWTPRKVELKKVPLQNGKTDVDALKAALGKDVACLLFQQPNYYGVLEDSAELIEAAHAAGAKVVMSADPVSLALLPSPGELGADVAVCEGQSLGLPLSFGGPYLGMISCTQKMVRKLPGRIVGETKDADGNRAFVLTLQAREQHIRREKASSNICSNQALCALGAAVYLAAMGPQGLTKAASASYSYAHYLAEKLCEIPGISLVYDAPFFNEFVTSYPKCPKCLEKAAAKEGMLSGLPVEGGILWCCTELNTKAQIDALVEIVKKEVSA